MKNTLNTTKYITIVFLSLFTVLSSFAGTWRDDFEDDNIKEWEIYNLNRQFEKWWIDDGEAVGEILEDPFLSIWNTGELSWEHYSVSCRVKLVEDGFGTPRVDLTLHDREDEDSRYAFLLDYENNIASIHRWAPGNGFVAQPFTVEIDTWYTLTATVTEEGSLFFQIDNFLFAGTDSSPLEGGKVGLIVGNARARFDNFQVTGENIPNGGPAKSFAVEPAEKLSTTWGKLKKDKGIY